MRGTGAPAPAKPAAGTPLPIRAAGAAEEVAPPRVAPKTHLIWSLLPHSANNLVKEIMEKDEQSGSRPCRCSATAAEGADTTRAHSLSANNRAPGPLKRINGSGNGRAPVALRIVHLSRLSRPFGGRNELTGGEEPKGYVLWRRGEGAAA